MLRLDAVPSGHGIDPYQDAEFGVDEIAWLYGDGLVGWSRGVVPLLADSLPEVLDGGRRYRYKLRNARWHDGNRLAAQDVANAYQTIRRGFWGTFEPYRSIREITITGARSFDVVLDGPVPGFVRSFFGPYGAFALPLLRSENGALPIGTGPFALSARVDLNRWRLERRDSSIRGIAQVDAIELRYLFARQTDYISLLSGETDIALPIPGRLRDNGRFRRFRRTTGVAMILFNAAGPFGTVEMRRAFAKTVDVAALQRAYDPLRASLFASFLMSGPNDSALERALRPDRGAADALRKGLQGHVLRILTQQGSTVDIVAGLVRQSLERAGIDARLVPIPYAGLYGPDSPLRRGDFDLAVNSYAYGDHADLAPDWSCASRAPSGGNFARWCDDGFDKAIVAGDAQAALRRLYDTVAAIPLSRSYEDIGVGPRVCGVSAPSLLIPATYSCVAWRIC